ncbi:unnamed protein product, partial [Mesorhabditis belari]|uniref:Nuclear protein localization protein 4 homolog n=1 Tax=Mesorhabditis belari TaxID=2138241 RepID=A0AAF3FG78_9BILA
MVVQASQNEKLDDVDVELSTQEGQVQRPRDPKMCHHNARQKCSHCLPIDPYDEEYLKSKDIKHMSFHAYVRKLTQGHGKGSKVRKPLETIRVKVDLTCDAHKPFPKGVCTRCRPPIMTLNRQRFRHVDNISMENQDFVNDFLNFWRKSGHQRVGFLIGRYESFPDVPLGIKAQVVAIYEPPQATSDNGVKLLDDKNKEMVDKVCDWLGLKVIGWIFTDLWSADLKKGTVHCTRNANSYLLSAEECITAGWLQNQHPNITQFSLDGQYGSKFVTVVASGDENQEVSFHGYQVSNQCAALAEANVLCPTQFPELAYIREKPLDESQYITDVQFTMKNEYGAEVTKDGRPLPVEFLLVDVPAGMRKDPAHTFHRLQTHQFHVENRETLGEIQGGQNLTEYCDQFSLNQFLEQATNFHFLLYLATNDMVKFTDEELQQLCDSVRYVAREQAMDWARENEKWHTLVALSHQQQAQGGPAIPTTSSGGQSSKWDCPHCTYHNDDVLTECSMCGLPRE